MSGAKETPRQKMIGMMYLVYTALLAMNVSKDILDAFDTVNAGVQETNITMMKQIEQRYEAFEEKLNTPDSLNVRPYWDTAQMVRDRSTEIINYLEAMKWDLVSTIEDKDYNQAVADGLLKSEDTTQYYGRSFFVINTSKIKSRDNYNKPTAYMMGDPEGTGRAFELSKKIKDYREFIVGIMGEEHIHELGLITDTQYTKDNPSGSPIDYAPEAADGIQKGWEYHNFHHTVLIADVTLLNKIISEVETAELNAITDLAQKIHAEDYTFNEIGAKVFSESSYILSGQKYKAQAMITAWQNNQIEAEVSLDGGTPKKYSSNSQGVIELEYNVGVGTHRYEGKIPMLDPKTNEMKYYDFSNTFTVVPPSVSVSATKMNVVYAGIDNPIAIGGGTGRTINASATGATLTSTGNGNYNLRVNTGYTGDVVVNVTSEGTSLGSMKFRVKELPKPTAKIDNVGADGKVTKQVLLAAGGVKADMGKDFFFDGIEYKVTGYTVKYKTKAGTVKEEKVSGDRFNENLRKVFQESNPGDFFMFTGIQVKGNDQIVKMLDSQIAVEIK